MGEWQGSTPACIDLSGLWRWVRISDLSSRAGCGAEEVLAQSAFLLHFGGISSFSRREQIGLGREKLSRRNLLDFCLHIGRGSWQCSSDRPIRSVVGSAREFILSF